MPESMLTVGSASNMFLSACTYNKAVKPKIGMRSERARERESEREIIRNISIRMYTTASHSCMIGEYGLRSMCGLMIRMFSYAYGGVVHVDSFRGKKDMHMNAPTPTYTVRAEPSVATFRGD